MALELKLTVLVPVHTHTHTHLYIYGEFLHINSQSSPSGHTPKQVLYSKAHKAGQLPWKPWLGKFKL